MNIHFYKWIVVTILLTASLMVVAQDFVPFPMENTRWRCAFSYMVTPSYITTSENDYYLEGDTVINDKLYAKVFNTGLISLAPDAVGYVREEAPGNGRVFFITTHTYPGEECVDTNEILMFDFNLVEGDTFNFKTCNVPNEFTTGEVYSVDSVMAWDGTFRKRISFNSLATEYSSCTVQWVEGIGNLGSPFYTLMRCFEWGETLGVMETNDEIVYGDLSILSAQTIEGKHDILLEPNPASDLLTVRLPDGLSAKGGHIIILNAVGQKMQDIPLAAGSSTTTISVQLLAAGVYWLQYVAPGSGLISKAFVVAR